MSTPVAQASARTPTEILLGLQSQLHDGSFYVADGIPAKKLENAAATFAHLQPHERALILVDTTVFGSAKEGAVLTDRGLYWKLGKESKDIPWIEVKAAACVDGGTLVWLTVNGSNCLQGGSNNKVAITVLSGAIRDIAIANQPRTNDFTPPEECTIPDPGKAPPGPFTVSWHQEKKPIPPGSGLVQAPVLASTARLSRTSSSRGANQENRSGDSRDRAPRRLCASFCDRVKGGLPFVGLRCGDYAR